MGSNIADTKNCNYRIPATLYTLEERLASVIQLQIPCLGDKKKIIIIIINLSQANSVGIYIYIYIYIYIFNIPLHTTLEYKLLRQHTSVHF